MVGFTGGIEPLGGFIQFNPNWGNIWGGFARQRDEGFFPQPFFPAQGVWDALKRALGSSPYERGVFDRTGPVIRPVVYGGVPERPAAPAPRLPGPPPAPPIPAAEEVEVAHDWGHVLRGATGSFASSFFAPQTTFPQAMGQVALAPSDLSGPADTLQTMSAADCSSYARCGTGRYLTYDCKDGTFKPRTRRRRRRLLTGRDISDLAALQAIAGKGAALQMAIATAVRR